VLAITIERSFSLNNEISCVLRFFLVDPISTISVVEAGGEEDLFIGTIVWLNNNACNTRMEGTFRI
jgi:hypothetical protein